MVVGVGRYSLLLEKDPELKRWHENLRRGSRITADNSLRQLGLLCKWWGIKPGDLLQMQKQGILQGKLEDKVSRLESKGYAGSYIWNLLKPVKSWLDFNGLKLSRRIKVSKSNLHPTTADERVPTKEELGRILRHLDRRGKAIAALIAFGGLRLETVGNYDGTDGLMLKDLPEMRINGKSVEFEKVPTMVKVRAPISKHRMPYFTFLASEGCTYLKEYLESRLLAEEELEPDSPIIGHQERRRNTIRKFLWTTKASAALRGSRRPGRKSGPTGIRGAGFDWRPYVLRSYTDTAFDIAESKGLISHPWRQFFMGHKGDIEARYSTNKGRLPPDMIEEMRAAYKRCEGLIQATGLEQDESKLKKSLREHLLLLVGFKREEMEKMDLLGMSEEELQQVASQKWRSRMVNNGSKQKVIPISEVESHLAQDGST